MRVQGAKRNPNLTQVTEPNVVLQSNTKSKIHNVFIVDASGSMSGGKYEMAIKGINELLVSIKNDNNSENTLTVVEFEERNIERRINMVTEIPIHYVGMGTGGGTPLNQTIGETLEYIVNTRNKKFNTSDKVLVNIFTDGGENNSRGKYREHSDVKKLIQELENQDVTVTFIGTKDDVAIVIRNLGIKESNTLIHNNTVEDVKRSFDTTIVARQLYSKSVSRGEDVSMNFYSKTVSQ